MEWNVFNLNKISLYQAIMLGLMSLLLQTNETLLFAASDTMLITRSGPEILPFLRMAVVLPSIFLTLRFYKYLMATNRKELNLYLFLGLFMALVLIFNLFLYPHQDQISLGTERLQTLTALYPKAHLVFRFLSGWVGALYFCLAVIWSKIVFAFILWRIADDVVWKKKKVFALIGVWLSLGTIASNLLVKFVIDQSGQWTEILRIFAGLFCTIAPLIVIFYNRLNFQFKRHSLFKPTDLTLAEMKQEEKHSLGKTLSYAYHNKIVFYLLMIVVFAVADNLVELIWKFQIRSVYPTQEGYAAFSARAGIASGLAAVLGSLGAVYMLNHARFRTNTYFAPLFLLIGSATFLTAVYLGGKTLGGIAISPHLSLWIGAIVISLNMVADYRIMYPTLRLMYDRMDETTRENSRYAFELYGKNIGSTFLAIITQTLLVFAGVMDLLPILGGIILVYCLARLYYSRRIAHLMGM